MAYQKRHGGPGPLHGKRMDDGSCQYVNTTQYDGNGNAIHTHRCGVDDKEDKLWKEYLGFEE